jgi:hypothetical protein
MGPIIMAGKAWRLVEDDFCAEGAKKAFTPEATNARQTTLYFTIVDIYLSRQDGSVQENEKCLSLEDANRVRRNDNAPFDLFLRNHICMPPVSTCPGPG